MAPAWVLLERYGEFLEEEAAVVGGASKDGGELFSRASKEAAAAAVAAPIGGASKRPVSIVQVLREAVYAILPTMKPDPRVADPPKVTSFSLVRQIPAAQMQGVTSIVVASTDKSLVVFYAGNYFPGSNGAGCYLIYDAMNNSLSTVPPLPHTWSVTCIGWGAAVLSRGGGEGAYVLAELVASPDHHIPDATLYLWWSSGWTPSQYPPVQWVKKAIRLPLGVRTPTYVRFDATFSFGGSCLCWVDLLVGIVVCDVLTAQEPKFSFIPLPEGCSLDFPIYNRPRLEDCRYVGLVGGNIKFVTMEGYLEGWPGNKITLTTWTLSPDLNEWKKGAAFCVGDLWANDEFQSRNLPQLTPMCPVLSMREDDVVYVVITHVEFVEECKRFGFLDRKVNIKGQYVLGLDMQCNKILSVNKGSSETMVQIKPSLIASEFSAYLHRSKDRQREVEASEVQATGKRMKSFE